MWKKIKTLRPVNWWYDQDYLTQVFDTAFSSTHAGSYPFGEMWYPVKIPTSTGMPDTYEWKNAGVDKYHLAEFYDTKFGTNYIIPRIEVSDYGELNTSKAISDLILKVESIARLNMRKYYKLIELNGFVYNPLFNVDGIELYSILQNEGKITTTNNPNGAVVNVVGDGGAVSYSYNAEGKITGITTSGNNVNYHYVNADDANDPNDQRLQSKDTAPNMTATDYTGYNTSTSQQHELAKNGEVDYTVSSKDNAFGQALTGADYYRAEKKVRQGNIGVTKTQELIEAEWNILRFNIIDEFFKDLNEQILVGLYDLS